MASTCSSSSSKRFISFCGRVLLALGLADDADDLVERVEDLREAFEDVDARVELVELEAEAGA